MNRTQIHKPSEWKGERSSKTVYEIVTEKILELLDKGTVPWRKPWAGGGKVPMSLATQRPYRGINRVLLGCQGYESPYWITFKECKKRGGHVRKGESSSLCVFWKIQKIRDIKINAAGEEEEVIETIPLLRYYRVFNTEQCGRLKVPEYKNEGREKWEAIEEAEMVFSGMPLKPGLEFRGSKAFYSPISDEVTLPKPEKFESDEAYYSTLFHELVHSTGHESRLSRGGVSGIASFGSLKYGTEELVAEMGSAFLCGHSGIIDTTIESSAAYIDSWRRTIKKDVKMVVVAAQQAQKAADFILDERL